MTTTELLQFIEGQAETPNLDFKAAMGWNVKSLAMDILAMSNVRDGGYIIIGVMEEGNRFVGTGVGEDIANTYEVDHMKDQLLRYADPAVVLRVNFPLDQDGKLYVVIRVLPFREVPVISKADIPEEVKANTIYYRNTSQGVRSAVVSNANDLRDIIESAAAKLMQRRRDFGFTAVPGHGQRMDEEIADLPKDDLLPVIQSKGHWEVRFEPLAKVELTEHLAYCFYRYAVRQSNCGGKGVPCTMEG